MATLSEVATPLNAVEHTLLGLQELRRRSPGAVLFCEGDRATGVYIVHSGAVDLVFAAGNGIARPLQTAEPGQVLGLSSVMSQRPCDSTAVVRTPAELGYVDGGKLLQLLERDPAAWLEVLRFLSHDVGSSWESMRRAAATR